MAALSSPLRFFDVRAPPEDHQGDDAGWNDRTAAADELLRLERRRRRPEREQRFEDEGDDNTSSDSQPYRSDLSGPSGLVDVADEERLEPG
ncbi:MAG: hypothetical protein L0H46_06730 [Brevibacterium sp.]|nr:hypothetical protein [Brevibacterium sp.]MDN5833580.1 hypothetical protein [Brevibacterium sp.]MDN5909037.1 hypothetical protein [Brevibacterium sp.]MDN6157410.1 hypothetical protein [Brevibacterium sp.]MDN6602438.1 hypothetical protein [Brevibacterium sp.]